MTRRQAMDRRAAVPGPAPIRFRWLRIAAIATAAVSLASCRGIPSSAILGTAAVSQAIDAVDPAGPATPAADVTGAEPAAAAVDATVSPAGVRLSAADWEREVRRVPATTHRDARVARTGLETPCPPLPRIGGPGCRDCAIAGPCADGACEPGGCGSACSPAACLMADAPPPVVGPYLVCDGGDHLRPAIAVGNDRLGHLTAGDTVARYRAADEMPDASGVRIVASNCACVYAPRFGAVREVTRPLEGSQPEGPRESAADAAVDLEELRQPICGKVQTVALETARKGLPGVAMQDRLGPLAVDQGAVPHEDDGVAGPVERVAEQSPELERRRQRPLIKVGFDVPIAWTCIKAANVLLGERSAEVVAADRGTATLRFEEPGRAELTLCKRAGTDTAREGEELDFTIVMLNSGDRPLTGIVLADALPTRLQFVPDSAAASLPAWFETETGDDGSTVLTWRIEDTLRPGESGFVRFRTIVK